MRRRFGFVDRVFERATLELVARRAVFAGVDATVGQLEIQGRELLAQDAEVGRPGRVGGGMRAQRGPQHPGRQRQQQARAEREPGHGASPDVPSSAAARRCSVASSAGRTLSRCSLTLWTPASVATASSRNGPIQSKALVRLKAGR